MATNRMGLREELVTSIAPGVNNRLKGHQLNQGEGVRFVQGAENVDIDAAGKPRRRKGTTQIFDESAHSLWADERGAYVVIDGVLQAITLSADGLELLASAPLYVGMGHDYPVSYSRGADGDLYLTNGLMQGRVTPANAPRAWATPAPQTPPVITVGAAGSGGLTAGLYLVTATRVTADGESPATVVQQVQVPDRGSMVLSHAEMVSYYVSGPDDDVLTLQVENATVPAQLFTIGNGGRICRMIDRMVMPAGEIVRHHNGRMLVARGSMLWQSDPYNYGIADATQAYFPFPSPITMLEAVEGLLFVGTAERTYRINGELAAATLESVVPYGALPGTSGKSPNDLTVFWQSQQGLCLADATGAVRNVQEKALTLGMARAGATLYREQDGMTHIVASREGASPSTSQASSFMEARIIRKGTKL